MTDSAPLRIVVLDDYQGAAATLGAWSDVPGEVDVVSLDRHIDDLDELVAAVGDATVLVAMRERTALTAEVIAALPSVKLIVTTGPFNAVIDVAAAAAAGVEARGTSGYLSPTSEHTWALILGLLRHVPAEDRAIREGRWQHTIGTELAGRVLGIVGLGRLGAAVARVAHAFDMEVIAWSPNLDAERAAAHDVRAVTREELFATADVVTVHMVLSERTHGLITAADLGRMKSSAVLVNTSRGPLIDEAALIEALASRSIGGAALDVFDHEPLPIDHPLRSLDNTVLSPHVGYVSDGLYELFYRHIVQDVAAWRRGEALRIIEP